MNEITTQPHKVALITGAARRMGAQIAKQLHEQCNVIIHYHRSEQEAFALAKNLNTLRPQSAALIQADLSDIQQIEALAQQAISYWGQLDILVNNASRFAATPLGKITETQWDELMNSNCKAA